MILKYIFYSKILYLSDNTSEKHTLSEGHSSCSFIIFQSIHLSFFPISGDITDTEYSVSLRCIVC